MGMLHQVQVLLSVLKSERGLLVNDSLDIDCWAQTKTARDTAALRRYVSEYCLGLLGKVVREPYALPPCHQDRPFLDALVDGSMNSCIPLQNPEYLGRLVRQWLAIERQCKSVGRYA